MTKRSGVEDWVTATVDMQLLIQELTPEQRSALYMQSEGLPVSEIADAVGVTEQAIYQRLASARKKAKEYKNQ